MMYFLNYCQATLLFILFSTALTAQIGKDFRNVRVKGPIVQMQATQTMIIKEEDGGTKERVMDQAQAHIDAGRIIKIDHVSGIRSAKLKSFTEFDWEEDRLRRVRTYSQFGDSRPNLDRQYVTRIGANGKISSENIFFGKDDLRATLSYEHRESAEGNEILEMTMYKPGELDPQGHYYIESDQWGEVLHIESVGKDTGIYVRRLENVGDSLFTGIKIMTSSRERGKRDTIWTTTLQRYDVHGNISYSEAVNKRRNPKGEGLSEMRMIMEVNYFYEGDDVPEIQPSAADLFARWSSSTYNFTLTIGNSRPSNLQGIYTTGTIRDKDPEIVEEGSDWIFRLRDSFTGSWEYDPATEIITFRQNEHVVAKAKVDLRFFELRLMPTEAHTAAVIFKKG
ncbi:MAG: hypothetical protein AAFP77_15510 [Bacteroidota bacterium]